jgi:hypothetical protein
VRAPPAAANAPGVALTEFLLASHHIGLRMMVSDRRGLFTRAAEPQYLQARRPDCGRTDGGAALEILFRSSLRL